MGSPNKPAKKSSSSWEGPGLSVSVHPQAWQSIAKLGGAPLHVLTRKDGKSGSFVDVHAVHKNKRLKQGVIKQAVKDGWLTTTTIWITSRWDDEWDSYMESTWDNEAEARENYDAEAGDKIKKKTGVAATPKLLARWYENFTSRLDIGLAFEMGLHAIAETSGYDGLWWEDDLDPSRLSAPRGVIFTNKTHAWQWKPSEGSPEEAQFESLLRMLTNLEKIL